MYDYISIRKDKKYSQKIQVSEMVSISQSVLGLKKIGNVSFLKEVGKYKINIIGILANSDGNYAYNDNYEFSEINLIEINIPQGAEDEHAQEILSLAKSFALPLNWEVEDHETGKILFIPNRQNKA